jgi:small subunit ribosomal protein S2
MRRVLAAPAAASRCMSGAAAPSSSLGAEGLNPYLRGSAASTRAPPPHQSFVDGVRASALLAARTHLGHTKKRTTTWTTGHLMGYRHNVAIFDIHKSWRSMRTLFHAFAEMAAARSSFFLLATNKHLPLQQRLERMRREYPFRHDRFTSLYMTGYADRKWIHGLFSNWRVAADYVAKQHAALGAARNPLLKRQGKVGRAIKGLVGKDAYSQIIPDFVLVLAADFGALNEIRNADLPMLGIADSDTDPRPFLYPVFANNDNIESINFVLDLIARAVEEGRRREQEAFALLLIKKVKQHLDPGAGFSEPLGPLAGAAMAEEDGDAAAPRAPHWAEAGAAAGEAREPTEEDVRKWMMDPEDAMPPLGAPPGGDAPPVWRPPRVVQAPKGPGPFGRR